MCARWTTATAAGMKALKRLMEKTDRVQIKGPGTDLAFQSKGEFSRHLRRRPATFPTAKFSLHR